jgi:hypothetical protein
MQRWSRCFGAHVALFVLTTSAVAAPQEFRLESLPEEVRLHVQEIRNSCLEADPQFKPYDPMQGITPIDLDGGAALMVDNEELCAPVRAAGFNCTNRGCDLKIWKQTSRSSWRVVFDEHLYRKFISLTDDGKLAAIVATIYAGSPQCRPPPNVEYTSGRSCDVLIRHRRGRWVWERLN